MNLVRTNYPFTIYRLPFTICTPFAVYRSPRLRAKGKGRVKGEELRVNSGVSL